MVGNQYRKNMSNFNGLKELVVDTSQEAIVRNANTVKPGFLGDFPGDDAAKIRGLKYVVTGDCESDLINIINVGSYDMRESLLDFCREELVDVFQSNNYMIGNAVLYPGGICHSFVLTGMDDYGVRIYDPWEGSIMEYCEDEVFKSGFQCTLGRGVIKWVQYISSQDKKQN